MRKELNTAVGGSGDNLLSPEKWKFVGLVRSVGQVSIFHSDGARVSGISQEDIPLAKNRIYALAFRARAEEGKRDDLVGLIASGANVTYCPMREFALSSSYRRNTCVYITPASEQKVTVQFLTLSRAAISVADVELSQVGTLPAAAGQYEIKRRSGNLTWFENRGVLPRAYFVRTLQPVPSYSDARSELWQMSAPLDLRSVALVEGLPADASRRVDQGSVQTIHRGANRIDLQVSCDGNCFLVLADQYNPGWQAYIDDVRTNIYPTDAVVRGLFVPAGAHSIRFAYKPPGLGWGFLAAALGIVLVCTLVWLDGGVAGRPKTAIRRAGGL